MKRILLIIGLILLLSPLPVFAAGEATSMTNELFPEDHSLVGRYPIHHYTFDSRGMKDSLNPFFAIGTLGMYVGTFILRIAMAMMTAAYHPPMMEGLLNAVVQIANGMKENLVVPMLPIVALVTAVLLLADVIRKDFSRAFSRVLKVVIVLVMITIYSNVSSPLVTTIVTAANSVTDTLSVALLNVTKIYSDTERQGMSSNVVNMTEQAWARLVIFPFTWGEMGGNLQVKGEHVDMVKSLVPNPQLLSEKPLWYEALLQLPPNDHRREEMVELLNSDAYPEAQAAFYPPNRFGVGVMTLVGSIVALLFFGVFGLLSLIVRLLFVLGVFVGVLVLAIELLPITRTNRALSWWIKFMSGNLFASLVICLYIALVMIVIDLTQNSADSKVSAVETLFFNCLIYGGAFFFALWAYKKYQPMNKFDAYMDKSMDNKSIKVGRYEVAKLQKAQYATIPPNIRKHFHNRYKRLIPKLKKKKEKSETETA